MKQIILLLALFSSIAIPCYANGLPAYLGTAFFHVLVINFFVIAAEYILLTKFTGSHFRFDIRLRYIIAANLVSLFAAYPFTDFFVHSMGIDQWFGLSKSGTISKQIFLLGAIIFIILTIIIEWLFYYLAIMEKVSFLRALKYTAAINLITNGIIMLLYLLTDFYQPTPD